MANVVEKVVAYITKDGNLLVFEHLDFPKAGIQVPSGTVKEGETPIQTAFREVFEETGLKNVEYVSYLGDELFDASAIDKNELHHRHYFHLSCNEAMQSWTHSEDDPDDGQEKSILFKLYWAPFEDVPILSGGLGKMLPQIRIIKSFP